MPKHQLATQITANDQLAPNVFRMALKAPEIAREAAPGQFVHLKITRCNDPLLRRPFSIFYADPAQGDITLVYQVMGRGSRMMSELRVGDEIDVMGPLGNGFDLTGLREKPEARAVLVGGGVGIPPLYFLATRITYDEGNPCCALVGAKTEAGILGEMEFFQHAISVQTATEDGSAGHHGLVTDILARELEVGDDVLVFACGPMGMLRAVADLCRKRGVPCQVSLEARMACAVGTCLGCAVPKQGGGYILTCSEGPVVNAEEVLW